MVIEPQFTRCLPSRLIGQATSLYSLNLPQPNGSDRSQWSRRRALAGYGAFRDAGPASVWRRSDHQHSQCRQPALAGVAWQAQSLCRASDIVLRVRRHRAAQDAEVVRSQPTPSLVRLRWSMDPLARRFEGKTAPVDDQHELFGFLTIEPNTVVAPNSSEGDACLLITPAEIDLWLFG